MTPARRQIAEFQFSSWRVPEFAKAIEYPAEVMEEIRAFACDELLQLSHGGNEVGGVLFGTRRDDLIRILTWRPIACDQTQGGGMRLSFNDRMNLAVQLEMARQNPDLKDLRPVGWFLSHLRGEVSLLPPDLETYNGFFPETWQVTLVVCPLENGSARAGFFVRETDRTVQAETSYKTFDLEPLHRAPALIDAAPTAIPEPEAAASIPPPAATPAQPEPPEAPNPLPARPQSLQVRELPKSTFQTPTFQTEESAPPRERWLWAIPIVLALGIAAFVLYQRKPPAPSVALAFHATNEAQTVQLAWDVNSRAIRDADRGEIKIDDGGKSSQVALTGDQLHTGKMSYLPQSGDVGFEMTVYPANGEPIQESTRLVAPAFNAPIQPPQLLTPEPPSPEMDGLKDQVHQLTEDLRKERARTEQLQNLVRILENRLGLQPEARKTTARP